MNSEDLKVYLASSLNETGESALSEISEIVDNYSEDYCLGMLNDAYKLFSAKVKTADESRLRTLGGCFFFIHRYRRKGKL